MSRQIKQNSSLFKSTARVNRIASLSETIGYYYLLGDNNVSEKSSKKARASLALAMLKEKQTESIKDDPENAIAYILSVTNLLFPDFMTYMGDQKTGSFKALPFPITMSEIASHFEKASDEESESGEFPDFDCKSMDLKITLADWEATLPIVAARWAVEVYPIGKAVTSDNLPGYRVNRIDAIRRTYKITAEDYNEALSDAALPTLSVLLSVERAFTVYKSIRKGFADYFIDAITAGATTREKDAFLLTFNLTDGFGLGAPAFIIGLLTAHPHLVGFPELADKIHSFLDATDEFELEPKETRGFMKVRYGSNHRLFAQSTRGALLALAVEFIAQTEPTAKRFMKTEVYAPVLDRANKFLISKGLPPITQTVSSNVVQAAISEA